VGGGKDKVVGSMKRGVGKGGEEAGGQKSTKRGWGGRGTGGWERGGDGGGGGKERGGCKGEGGGEKGGRGSPFSSRGKRFFFETHRSIPSATQG